MVTSASGGMPDDLITVDYSSPKAGGDWLEIDRRHAAQAPAHVVQCTVIQFTHETIRWSVQWCFLPCRTY